MVLRLIVCVALIPGVVEAAQPEAADQCARRMRAIAESARAYKKDKGRLPAHLSDLVPIYLKDAEALQCPADRVGGLPYLPFFPPEWRLKDPKLPVSYYYMRAETPCPHLFTSLNPARLPDGATVRQRMEAHRVNFGETIPLLHCNHHTPAFRQAVMVDGTIHRGGPLFEYDAYVYPVVLERLHADASDPALLRRNWWLPAVEQYLTPW